MRVAVSRGVSLLHKEGQVRNPRTELKNKIIEYFFYHSLVDNNGRHLDEMSYKGWFVSDIVDFDANGGDYHVAAGYMALIAPEYSTVHDKIMLEHIVMSIDWTGPSVKVTTSKGIFQARHVIITLPVPVMASGQVSFQPPLPIEKRVAIQGITMGFATLNGSCFISKKHSGLPMSTSALIFQKAVSRPTNSACLCL